MSYCSETLKDIFLELPPAGGILAIVVGCKLGYWRISVGRRRELQLNCCVQLAGEVRRCELDREYDSEEIEHGLRPLFVSTRTEKTERCGHCLQDTSCVLVRIHPARAPHGETVSVMMVSSAPRAPWRRGTKRESRVDNGALAGTKATV